MSLTVLKAGIRPDELQPWGNAAALGFEIIEGAGELYGQMTFGAPTDPIHAAYFAISQGKYRVTYPFAEQATVLSGELLITDESTGITSRFKAGDSFFVEKGTRLVMEAVNKDGFVKHYLAFS